MTLHGTSGEEVLMNQNRKENIPFLGSAACGCSAAAPAVPSLLASKRSAFTVGGSVSGAASD